MWRAVYAFDTTRKAAAIAESLERRSDRQRSRRGARRADRGTDRARARSGVRPCRPDRSAAVARRVERPRLGSRHVARGLRLERWRGRGRASRVSIRSQRRFAVLRPSPCASRQWRRVLHLQWPGAGGRRPAPHGAERIAIVDVDAHMGGGTSSLVRDVPGVVHVDVAVSSGVDAYPPPAPPDALAIVSARRRLSLHHRASPQRLGRSSLRRVPLQRRHGSARGLRRWRPRRHHH